MILLCLPAGLEVTFGDEISHEAQEKYPPRTGRELMIFNEEIADKFIGGRLVDFTYAECLDRVSIYLKGQVFINSKQPAISGASIILKVQSQSWKFRALPLKPLPAQKHLS